MLVSSLLIVIFPFVLLYFQPLTFATSSGKNQVSIAASSGKNLQERNMRNYWKKGRRDDNEKVIKEYLTEKNIPFVMLYPSQGADLLLLLEGGTVLLEVKNPSALGRRRGGSEKEREMKALCLRLGIPYLIASTVEEIEKFLEL